MPGFTTHYLFGIEAYKRIPEDSLRYKLKKYHGTFALGLQGPDVFFYYLPSYLMHKENLGALVHDRDGGKFFFNLLKSRQLFICNNQELEVADAYIMGFLGHYTLDCKAHPYIYAFTNYDPKHKPKTTEYFGQHAYLETEIDNELLWKILRLRPTQFHQNDTIRMSVKEESVVSKMLTFAYRNTFQVYINSAIVKGAIHWMQSGTKMVNDPYGQKKVLVRLIERYLLGRAFVSPMLPSDNYRFVRDPMNEKMRIWEHPWTKEKSTASFLNLFECAKELYVCRLKKYQELVENKFPEVRVSEFMKDYGNRSFLSGEEL